MKPLKTIAIIAAVWAGMYLLGLLVEHNYDPTTWDVGNVFLLVTGGIVLSIAAITYINANR